MVLSERGAPRAKCVGLENPPQKGGKRGVPAHKGCAPRVQKGGSSAERRVHKGCTKGAEMVQKGARTPLPARGGGGIWENGPFRARLKITHQKGREHVLSDPKTFSRTQGGGARVNMQKGCWTGGFLRTPSCGAPQLLPLNDPCGSFSDKCWTVGFPI